jgi:hypothetical protein
MVSLVCNKTTPLSVCSGLFIGPAIFPGLIKKENKTLVKRREKVYTFSSLKRDQPGRIQALSV